MIVSPHSMSSLKFIFRKKKNASNYRRVKVIPNWLIILLSIVVRIIVIGILSIIRVAIRVGIIALLLSLLSIIVLVGAIRIARLVGILTLILLNHE